MSKFTFGLATFENVFELLGSVLDVVLGVILAQVVLEGGDGGVLGLVHGDDGVLDGVLVARASLLGAVHQLEGASQTFA